jgi:hypothetical protein
LNRSPDAGPWTWLVLWLLKLGGEPWLWSISGEQLGPFLNEHDWTISNDQTESSDKCGIEFYGIAVK